MLAIESSIKGSIEDSNIVKLLIEKGADVNKKNNDGKTALMFAVKYSHSNIVNLLIKKNVNLDIEDRFGRTVYSYIIFANKVQTSNNINLIKKIISNARNKKK